MFKTTCAMCGNKDWPSKMFTVAPGSRILQGMDRPDKIKLCNTCNFRNDYITKEIYKRYSVDEAYKFFAGGEHIYRTLLNNIVVDNYKRMVKDLMGGYPDYRKFQEAMNAVYCEEGANIVTGLFAVNAGRRCFSVIQNGHISKPYGGAELQSVEIVEDGDEEFVKTLSLVFKFKDSSKKDAVINLIDSQGVSRQSTIYKESMETHGRIMELLEKIRG